jgi:Family of unknown function (DUF5681)
MTNRPLLPDTSTPDDSPSSDAAYPIGYGKPPMHTRFKPGHSGNAKGRPKRRRNVRTILQEVLSEKVKIKVGAQTRSLTKSEVFVHTVVNDAINRDRDAKSRSSLMVLLHSAGMMDDAPEENHSEPFTVNDLELIEDFLRRQNAASEQPDGPRDDESPNADPKSPDKGAKS